MSDKVRKLSILLQALSRLPGLGFLAETEYKMRETADSFDEVGDRMDEGKRQYKDIKEAAEQVARDDE